MIRLTWGVGVAMAAGAVGLVAVSWWAVDPAGAAAAGYAISVWATLAMAAITVAMVVFAPTLVAWHRRQPAGWIVASVVVLVLVGPLCGVGWVVALLMALMGPRAVPVRAVPVLAPGWYQGPSGWAWWDGACWHQPPPAGSRREVGA